MMKGKFISVLLMLPTIADAGFYDGNRMLENCRERTAFVSTGFAAGILDTLQLDNQTDWKICPPASITAGQARDVMCKHLEDNPASRHQSAAFLGWQSFYEAWPCPN